MTANPTAPADDGDAAALTIRPFEPRDRAALIALWHACGLVHPVNDPDKDIDRKLAWQPSLLWVGEAGGRLVASVMVGYEGHRGWMNYLGVHPQVQGRGHGRRLVEAAEAWLRAQGGPKMNLQVRSTNAKVLGFYAALGYEVEQVACLGKRLIPDTPPAAPG